jgi:hypothetical protein
MSETTLKYAYMRALRFPPLRSVSSPELPTRFAGTQGNTTKDDWLRRLHNGDAVGEPVATPHRGAETMCSRQNGELGGGRTALSGEAGTVGRKKWVVGHGWHHECQRCVSRLFAHTNAYKHTQKRRPHASKRRAAM